jgi:hypothetical protein
MAVPWRAAEAMHWRLGEKDMARRAGVTPFHLATGNADSKSSDRSPPSYGDGHRHSQINTSGVLRVPFATVVGNRTYSMPSASIGGIVLPTPPSPTPTSSPLSPDPTDIGYVRGLTLPPIAILPRPWHEDTVPGLAEVHNDISRHNVLAVVPTIGRSSKGTSDLLYSTFVSDPRTSAGTKRQAFTDRCEAGSHKRQRIA